MTAAQTGFAPAERGYLSALALLNGRRRKIRPTTPDVNTSPTPPAFSVMPAHTSDLRGIPSTVGMSEWLSLLGHSQDDLARLNVVHVAGTKGKGSTCAFTRGLLEAHGSRTGWPRKGKVGMYTSPDLVCIRERIQLGASAVSEEMFAKYFFEVHDILEQHKSDTQRQPRFLQMLCLMALHMFVKEGVDVAIIETHHGGEFDATNVIERPVVTAVTSVGMDHVLQLGPSIENIAWHKSGIYKRGARALTVRQDDDIVEAILRQRAEEKDETLTIVEESNPLKGHNETSPEVLLPKVQRTNLALAVEIANALLERKSPIRQDKLSPHDQLQGVLTFNWPGRFQRIRKGKEDWFLDGAHNELSIKQAVGWFKSMLDPSSPTAPNSGGSDGRISAQIIIFSHISDGRSPVELLMALKRAVDTCSLQPDYVIFTTYQEKRDGKTRPDKTLQEPSGEVSQLPSTFPGLWTGDGKEMAGRVFFEPSIEEALDKAKLLGRQYDGVQTLITGSLHLVGGALYLLQNTTDSIDTNGQTE